MERLTLVEPERVEAGEPVDLKVLAEAGGRSRRRGADEGLGVVLTKVESCSSRKERSAVALQRLRERRKKDLRREQSAS
jgi:hypothetical protein